MDGPETASRNVEDPHQAKTIFNLLSKLKDEPNKSIRPTEDSQPNNEEIEDIVILRRDSKTQQKYINKPAYLKLHRSLSPTRTSVDRIKEKFDGATDNQRNEREESKVPRNETLESIKNKYSPSAFGYSALPVAKPRRSRLVKSQIITAPTTDRAKQKLRYSLNVDKYGKKKDVNSNDLDKDAGSSGSEEYLTIVTNSRKDSIESVLKFQEELDAFTMDKKKRTSSFRKLFAGKIFGGKDKKKKEDAKATSYKDNAQNESNKFMRQSPYRHTTGGENMTNKFKDSKVSKNDELLERDYAQMHINQFNRIKRDFEQPKAAQGYVSMDKPIIKSTDTSPYVNIPGVRKYIDTSSSASTLESDRSNLYQNEAFARANQAKHGNDDKNSLRSNKIGDTRRDTPPRATETRQDLYLVNPKALIPINSERPLPNPYQSSSGVSSEEKLPNSHIRVEETYGTVLDSLETGQKINAPPPRSPSLEPSKLKLPQRREIVPLSPRIRSPIPPDNMSTEKIIATELLKARRSPIPSKKEQKEAVPSHQRLEIDIDYPDKVRQSKENILRSLENLISKPPVATKPPPKPARSPIAADYGYTAGTAGDRVVTNAQVHSNSPSNRTPTPSGSVQNVSLSPSRSTRSTTPLNARIPESPKTTPQKEDMRKSVEAYYWKEIKKLKDQENYELYMYQMRYANAMPYGYGDEAISVRRSRSLSPSVQRNGRRSLSLPRESRPSNNVIGYRPNAIPEGRALTNAPAQQPRSVQQIQFQQNFVRNAPERRTVDGGTVNYSTNSLYRPIFKRGSLSSPPTQQQIVERKVSFSNSGDEAARVWPTRNGFTRSPPQRRIEQLDSQTDDEVFLPNATLVVDGVRYRRPPNVRPREELYYNAEPVYGVRNLQRVVEENPYAQRYKGEVLYGQPMDALRTPRGLTRHGSVQIDDEIYGQRGMARRLPPTQQSMEPLYVARQEVVEKPMPPRRQIIVKDDIFGQFGGYVTQQTSGYPSRQSIVDYNNRVRQEYYQQKQVSVSNKVCDMYGQIHDVGPSQSGVLMGQLSRNSGTPVAVRNSYSQLPRRDQFVRNGRLTASANDMYRRGGMENIAPTRPLPPLPQGKAKGQGRSNGGPSDTESGSDAGEVQRILNGKGKTKKRGIFGK
ncbi:uncharacterized protein LOC132696851 [Cylas formicarius]|uniref:uncharacterized protein LOC132696851 n=1 Tax=Cylas formicarius TaxID=197179 RepID=UPI0029587BDC|nr:uncharacterized protein LOC132696851 [Cylas formicarius]XP_060517918.1 uncharacterized protein LOC132696851 [Cylas formicarius]